jgi:hypothetical protein
MHDHDTYPAALALPAGVAQLVPGMAVYLLDGVPIDVDVEIPPDLRDAGWCWFGTFLYQQLSPGGCAISFYTGTIGLPGAFDAARRIEARRAEKEAARGPEQLTMFEMLEAA